MAINTQSSQTSLNSQNGDAMQSYISESQTFQGAFTAHVDGQSIPCYNAATARAQIVGTKEHTIVNSKRSESKSSPRLKCMGFVSPSGQFYAVVPNIRMDETIYDCRIDCANESTLRSLMNGGVHLDTIHHAIQTPSNLRPSGGWAA